MIRPFEYIAPGDLERALAALSERAPDAKVLAGGTDLLLEMRRPGVVTPRVVVDIGRLNELRGIAEINGSVVVGPLVTHAETSSSPSIRRYANLLSAAASAVGSPQIRNRGTVGGNVMNAAPCADSVPPLIALGARVTLRSARGSREVDVADFFVKPYVTVALPDELLTEIRFPKLPPGTRSSFVKLGRRNAVAIARLSVAAVLAQDKRGVITDARVVPGSAFPIWRRVGEAERLLIGEKPSAELFSLSGRIASEAMVAATGRRWSTEYKERVLPVLVRRALESCLPVHKDEEGRPG